MYLQDKCTFATFVFLSRDILLGHCFASYDKQCPKLLKLSFPWANHKLLSYCDLSSDTHIKSNNDVQFYWNCQNFNSQKRCTCQEKNNGKFWGFSIFQGIALLMLWFTIWVSLPQIEKNWQLKNLYNFLTYLKITGEEVTIQQYII